MSGKEDLSPPCVKSTYAQPTVVENRGEFRPSLKQPHVFHPDDDFESWEFAVTIYLTGVPENSMGPYILSFLSEEAAKMFRTTGVRPTAPAAVIWETLRQLFEKIELPAVYRETFFSRRQEPEESVDRFLRVLRELASKAFKHLSSVECERNICERFCMGLRNRELRNKFILKPAESLSVALTKARGCEALEQLDEKRAAKDSICLAFRQHSLTPEPLPRRNQLAVPVGGECWYCKRFGRRAQHCGHNPPIGSRSPKGESLTLHEALSSVISPKCVYMKPLSVRGRINKEPILFLVDTGASCSLIHSRLAARLTKHRTAPANPVRLLAANGTEMQVASFLSASVQLGSFSGEHQFLACPHLQWKAILGMDFLGHFGGVLNLKDSQMTIGSCLVDLEKGRPADACSAVDSKAEVPFVSEVLNHLKSDESLLPMKTQLIHLLSEFKDVFALGNDAPGRTNWVQHEIDTSDHRPIRHAPRRLPVHYEQHLDTMITDMLEKRIIRPSVSPWSSPIVLVRKKNGTLRLCVDYRKLNEITARDSFPIPRIDATLDALHGAQWFSALDLASGYWQVEVRPSDRGKTAFVVPSGLYEFETMPFGLANAPATFQRLMQKALQGLVPSQCLIYLDDIIVYGRTVAEHNNNLRDVLERLRSTGLKLKGSKCHFLQREVTFLGHVIAADGIKTDPAKSEQIKNWPRPQTVENVRSFLGLASYYRKFIQGFAEIATPLHRLTEKGRPFTWSDECSASFETLKDKLTTPPILAFPDVSDEAGKFVLDTDASNVSIGAVLSQETPEGEVVIAYASRCLDKCERNYSTTRRELLALIHFLRHFRPYLLGKPFKVRTDHQSLQWLRNFRDPEGQVARWQERLQEYDFVCEYRRGLRHGNADALSRVTVPSEVNTTLLYDADTVWAEDQLSDSYIANIYKRQADGSSKPSAIEMRQKPFDERALWGHWKDLRLIDGVLYRMDQSGPKLITPKLKVAAVLQKIHTELGHAGQLKTEAAIRQRYWWPGIHADVVTQCSSCETCSAIKNHTPGPRAPLEPVVTEHPGQRVGVDIMGPLPVTRRGNRYILVLVDYFTKWSEAVPIERQDACTVAAAIINEWIARYGAPTMLHSDQGAAFESQLLKETCHLLGIKKTRTTPYHPQGNGLVERTNRTIKALLQSFLERHQADRWDELLPRCMLAYRASIHTTTRYTPAYLTFGRELRLPLELLSPIPPLEALSLPDYVRNLRENLRTAFTMAQGHMKDAQRRQKEQYDQHISGPVYSVGCRVWLHRPKAGVGEPAKLHRQWQGPYEVVFVRSPTVYVIRDPQSASSDVLTPARCGLLDVPSRLVDVFRQELEHPHLRLYNPPQCVPGIRLRIHS
ncbi:uncharacterized protein DEA37_0001986 [Paragonimus westermani]|uniref:RNA-directed DNA polymerase n=1 Tax=Paragonimus westermani TaxID=34504 RepID=A0A5J4NFG7_9TREM|nr:uncharacterized protein DEA37_0001986 [Paragonimus westermani]